MASKDKQPVGFATHIIAGGTAGMAEAVRVSRSPHWRVFTPNAALLPTVGYHQSQDAVIQVG
jgi:hypothetical protein